MLNKTTPKDHKTTAANIAKTDQRVFRGPLKDQLNQPMVFVCIFDVVLLVRLFSMLTLEQPLLYTSLIFVLFELTEVGFGRKT